MPQPPQLEVKAKATTNNNKPVRVQQGIGTAHKLVEKIQTSGFYPAIKGKGKLKRRRKEEFHNLQFIRKRTNLSFV